LDFIPHFQLVFGFVGTIWKKLTLTCTICGLEEMIFGKIAAYKEKGLT